MRGGGHDPPVTIPRVRFVILLEGAAGADAVRGLKHTLRFAWRWCGLKCVYAAELGGADDYHHDYSDLFPAEHTADSTAIAGLVVQVERPCRHCGATLTTIIAGKGPHSAALECVGCGHFVKWLPRTCCAFLAEVVARCGRPTDPVRIFEQVNRNP
jgi:hypothetical protein